MEGFVMNMKYWVVDGDIALANGESMVWIEMDCVDIYMPSNKRGGA
jgi:hypothetical protein